MDQLTIQNADTQCQGTTPFLVPFENTADVSVAHISGMVAGTPATPTVRVTQMAVQVLWQENPGGSPGGCNVDNCSSCQLPSPSNVGGRGLASRRWRLVVTQGPATGGDTYVCSDYRTTGVIEYDRDCQWSGTTDQGDHPILLSKNSSGYWELSVNYGSSTLIWKVFDQSFKCCEFNNFGCQPLGFPCPPANHPYPCATLEPYVGTNLSYTGLGGPVIGGQMVPAIGYKVFPVGSNYTSAFKARMQGAELGSPATGDVLAVLDSDFASMIWVISYRGFPIGETITDAHFHLSPSYGASGPVIRGFSNTEKNGSTVPSGKMQGFWTSTDSQPLTLQRVKDLQDGLIYANIHTNVNPTGEIKGILVGKMISGAAQLNQPHSATGGLTLAGSAVAVANTFVVGSAGGAVAGGTPALAVTRSYIASGGVQISGIENFRHTMSGGVITSGSAIPTSRIPYKMAGGVVTSGIATITFNRAASVPTGGMVLAGNYGRLGLALNPLVRGGATLGGIALCHVSLKYAAVPAAITLGGAAFKTVTGIGYVAVPTSVTIDGTHKINNLGVKYIAKYPNNRFFVFGNASYGRNNYEFSSLAQGPNMGGKAKIVFCKSPCDTSVRYFRDLEGAPGCKVVDPDTGQVNFVCSRLTYYVGDKKRRAGQGAYLPAITVCTNPKSTGNCYKDRL